jgi:hypothetical protein
MLVKAGKLKVGDKLRGLGGQVEVISRIEPYLRLPTDQYPGGVMVFFESQKNNPFVSSQYASYNLSTLVEVVE